MVLLSAMKDIDKICRENGLRYYLYAGTLLGALNHKGFIPWDDDVDIVMFPEDFRVFCNVIDREYSEIYAMHNYDNDSGFYTKMNALWILGTKVHAEGETKGRQFNVDIQVLHNCPNNKVQRYFQRKQIELLNLISCSKSGHIKVTSWKSRMFFGMFKNISREALSNKMNKALCRYDKRKTKEVGIMCNTMTPNPYTGASGYENDITQWVWHENPIYLPFEDTEFMTISEPEKDMVHRYGPHWHEPYPEEKRVTKHGVKSYEISNEVRRRVGLL